MMASTSSTNSDKMEGVLTADHHGQWTSSVLVDSHRSASDR